jgi:hypothetical protein
LGPRALTLASVCLYAAAACAPERSAITASAPPPSSAASGAPGAGDAPPEAPVDLEPESALGLGSGDSEILVRTSVLRGHPVGAHVGPVLGMWPGWRSTLQAIARDPVADFDWIDVVGPPDPSHERMLARASGGASDAAIDGHLVALQARSAEPAGPHVEGRIVAAAAPLDGVLRVVFRPQAHFVAATAAQRGPALSHLLARARLQTPAAPPLEAIRIDRLRPHDAVSLIPASIRRIQAHVLALANGDADASADGDCDSAGDAVDAATALRDTIARQNFSLVRMLTHGLLDAIAVTSEGSVVKIHLHARRDQLEAVLSLVTPMVPADTGR